MSGAAHALESVPGLSALVAAQQGVVTRAQLRSLGVDAQDVGQQLASRRWQTLSAHVVAVFTGPVPRRSTIWGAALHGQPGGLIGAWTGLEVHGLVRWERSACHLLVPRGRTVLPIPGVIVHESRRLDATRDAHPGLGLPVVAPARAAIDAAAWSDLPTHAAALIAAVVQQRIVGAHTLLGALESAGRIRFSRAIRQAIEAVAEGADSLGEMRIGPILTAAGLPAPRRQTPRFLHGVLRRTDVEVDLPDGSVLVIEIDGRDHDDPARRAEDALRDLDNLVEDRVTIRVSPWAIAHRGRDLIARFTAVRLAAERRAAAHPRDPSPA